MSERVRFPSSVTPIVLNNAAASFPVPTANGAGGDISGQRGPEGHNYSVWNIHLAGTQACQFDQALAVYGEKDDGEMGLIGVLNNGDVIHIASAAVGFDEPIAFAGAFKKLLVGGYTATATPTAGTITATARPLFTKIDR